MIHQAIPEVVKAC
ncbi:hypothetical protein OIU74_017146 [Salix koriyanagi]|nr:hypothetical protein OIU74_017146 [Salix koriyanagi]